MREQGIAEPIVGCWQFVESDDPSFEPAELDIRGDGRLFYSIDAGDRWQIMKLTWRVEGDVIVTDQPSHPSEARSRFAFDETGQLVTYFEGRRTRFKRGPKRAPEV